MVGVYQLIVNLIFNLRFSLILSEKISAFVHESASLLYCSLLEVLFLKREEKWVEKRYTFVFAIVRVNKLEPTRETKPLP